MKKYYIGLSITYHDSAIAIVDEKGQTLFAEATERHLQNKRALNCEPDNLVRIPQLLREFCSPDAEFVVATNWLKKRPLSTRLSFLVKHSTAQGMTIPDVAEISASGYKNLFLDTYKVSHMMICQKSAEVKRASGFVRQLRDTFGNLPVRFVDLDHHLTHAALGCYTSPFDEAVCAVVDSFGEHGALAYFHYKDGKLKKLKEQIGNESMGFLYMKITEVCGFQWLKGEEWKVMGLAPYGEFDQEVYDILKTLAGVSELFLKANVKSNKVKQTLELLETVARQKKPENVAHTGQKFFGELMTQLLSNLHRLNISENLVLSGGCALNSSFNGKVLKKTSFQKLHVPSAPGDDGCALGAALIAYHQDTQKRPAPVSSPYLGSRLSKTTLDNMVKLGGIAKLRHLPDTICQETAALLAQGKLVGWAQGRAEYGPRALGNRSILADPRSFQMKDKINSLVKFREEFRPFAPAILDHHAAQYFIDYQESRYMERTLHFQPEVYDKVPAVVHVDKTGRLQTVKREWNERFYDVLQAFFEITQVPVLLNTSFNIMGKPIIHSVEDAIALFYTTGLEVLVLEDYIIEK